ncbi:MAG TPA: hypothetical protein PLG79_02400 [Spirochaetales bacterium]|nr:hypothetical protein [Spirochaetales bacterium]HOV37546.1 hypothetical protein [Spirochaetales bacterium]
MSDLARDADISHTTYAYEIKSSATFRPEFVKNLKAWGHTAGIPDDHLSLLYNGDESFVYQGVSVLPWREALFQ